MSSNRLSNIFLNVGCGTERLQRSCNDLLSACMSLDDNGKQAARAEYEAVVAASPLLTLDQAPLPNHPCLVAECPKRKGQDSANTICETAVSNWCCKPGSPGCLLGKATSCTPSGCSQLLQETYAEEHLLHLMMIAQGIDWSTDPEAAHRYWQQKQLEAETNFVCPFTDSTLCREFQFCLWHQLLHGRMRISL